MSPRRLFSTKDGETRKETRGSLYEPAGTINSTDGLSPVQKMCTAFEAADLEDAEPDEQVGTERHHSHGNNFHSSTPNTTPLEATQLATGRTRHDERDERNRESHNSYLLPASILTSSPREETSPQTEGPSSIYRRGAETDRIDISPLPSTVFTGSFYPVSARRLEFVAYTPPLTHTSDPHLRADQRYSNETRGRRGQDSTRESNHLLPTPLDGSDVRSSSILPATTSTHRTPHVSHPTRTINSTSSGSPTPPTSRRHYVSNPVIGATLEDEIEPRQQRISGSIPSSSYLPTSIAYRRPTKPVTRRNYQFNHTPREPVLTIPRKTSEFRQFDIYQDEDTLTQAEKEARRLKKRARELRPSSLLPVATLAGEPESLPAAHITTRAPVIPPLTPVQNSHARGVNDNNNPPPQLPVRSPLGYLNAYAPRTASPIARALSLSNNATLAPERVTIDPNSTREPMLANNGRLESANQEFESLPNPASRISDFLSDAWHISHRSEVEDEESHGQIISVTRRAPEMSRTSIADTEYSSFSDWERVFNQMQEANDLGNGRSVDVQFGDMEQGRRLIHSTNIDPPMEETTRPAHTPGRNVIPYDDTIRLHDSPEGAVRNMQPAVGHATNVRHHYMVNPPGNQATEIPPSEMPPRHAETRQFVTPIQDNGMHRYLPYPTYGELSRPFPRGTMELQQPTDNDSVIATYGSRSTLSTTESAQQRAPHPRAQPSLANSVRRTRPAMASATDMDSPLEAKRPTITVQRTPPQEHTTRNASQALYQYQDYVSELPRPTLLPPHLAFAPSTVLRQPDTQDNRLVTKPDLTSHLRRLDALRQPQNAEPDSSITLPLLRPGKSIPDVSLEPTKPKKRHSLLRLIEKPLPSLPSLKLPVRSATTASIPSRVGVFGSHNKSIQKFASRKWPASPPTAKVQSMPRTEPVETILEMPSDEEQTTEELYVQHYDSRPYIRYWESTSIRKYTNIERDELVASKKELLNNLKPVHLDFLRRILLLYREYVSPYSEIARDLPGTMHEIDAEFQEGMESILQTMRDDERQDIQQRDINVHPTLIIIAQDLRYALRWAMRVRSPELFTDPPPPQRFQVDAKKLPNLKAELKERRRSVKYRGNRRSVSDPVPDHAQSEMKKVLRLFTRASHSELDLSRDTVELSRAGADAYRRFMPTQKEWSGRSHTITAAARDEDVTRKVGEDTHVQGVDAEKNALPRNSVGDMLAQWRERNAGTRQRTVGVSAVEEESDEVAEEGRGWMGRWSLRGNKGEKKWQKKK